MASTTRSLSAARARNTLAKRLRDRRSEIEATALTRVKAVADPEDAGNPAYVEGLRTAVSAAVDYGLLAVECGAEHPPPIPVALLAQARIAARNNVSLDTVLRRYFAGYSLLGYFIIEEAGRDGLMSGPELQSLLTRQAGIFDRLLATIGEEHTRESELRLTTSTQKRAERIEGLLAGEMPDISRLAYEFSGWHLGLVVTGAEIERPMRDLAAGLDCRPLFLQREEGMLWAWLGSRRRLDPANFLHAVASSFPVDHLIAIGEPGEGIVGWRLTHRQAAAALPIAQRGPENVVRYADVALIASALQDELLTTSLHQLYVTPLQDGRDDGASLRDTLIAYFEHGRNSASAAAALGVTRQTVNNRLRMIEERIGLPMISCASELEVAMRLSLR